MQIPGFPTVRGVDPHHLQRYLLPHEEISVIIRRHPAMMLRQVGETTAALVVAGVLSDLISNDTIIMLIWCAWLLVVSRLIAKAFEWFDEYFGVTNVRVILVHGLVIRRVDMMPLKKITDLTLNRSVLGRMFGYGTVVLESAGQDQALSAVEYVPEPEAVYLEISAVVFGFADD